MPIRAYDSEALLIEQQEEWTKIANVCVCVFWASVLACRAIVCMSVHLFFVCIRDM